MAVTGKIVFLKDLRVTVIELREFESPLIAISSLTDWIELIRHTNVLDWRGYLLFRDLTWDFPLFVEFWCSNFLGF